MLGAVLVLSPDWHANNHACTVLICVVPTGKVGQNPLHHLQKPSGCGTWAISTGLADAAKKKKKKKTHKNNNNTFAATQLSQLPAMKSARQDFHLICG